MFNRGVYLSSNSDPKQRSIGIIIFNVHFKSSPSLPYPQIYLKQKIYIIYSQDINLP